MSNLLITGGSGYVGSRLIYKLLDETKIKIINYDISLFGDEHLPKNDKFLYYKDDITDPVKFENVIKENEIDTVLHLACISNDPTYELNTKLSKKINYECFEDLVKIYQELINWKKIMLANNITMDNMKDKYRIYI